MKKEVISRYMTYRKIECKSKDALVNYERYITSLLGMAKEDLSDLDETYLTDHVNKISNKFSQKSLNNIKPLFKNFIKWYFPDYSIRFRNLDKICKSKRAESSYAPKDMLTEKDVKKIIETETDFFWKVFWLVFFHGGYRGIDVVRLKWDFVTFEKDGTTIIDSVLGKNKTRFIKVLPVEVTPLLKKWREINFSEWVFPSPRGDYPIHPKTPNERLTRLSKKALGRHINPYTLRHSFATINYNKEGADEDIVANQMGHHKSMKETYVHLDDTQMVKRAKRFLTTKNEMPKEEKDMLLKKIKLMEEQLAPILKEREAQKAAVKKLAREYHGELTKDGFSILSDDDNEDRFIRSAKLLSKKK